MKEQTFERILVVDDEELMREMTLALVLMMGYPCDAVSSGEEAMERLQTEHFDIVVSDITMKGMNGLEFMEKAKERFPQLGFIIMTAYTSEYSYSDIIKAGAIDYLAKPFEQAELEARLQRALRERRLFRQLKESEKRYRALFQGAAQGILVADIETKELKYANPAICTMLGYTEEELEGMSVGDIHPKEALEHVISEFQAQARGEKTLAPCIPCLRKDGTTVYADINTTRVFIGGTECNVGFFTDITERKHAEEALRESENRYRTQFEQILDAVFVADAETGILIDCNQAALELVGRARSELVGKHHGILHPPEQVEREFSCCCLKQHRTDKLGQALETKVVTKSGEIRDVLITASTFTLKGRKVLQGMFRDVTERKQAETELAQGRKLEAVGQLAAGIAHEINTPTQFVGDNITFLKGALDDLFELQKKQNLLLQAAKAGKVKQEVIQAVETAAEIADIDYLQEEVPKAVKASLDGVARISKIVRAMKEFSHPGAADMALFDINKAIETTITVARNEWKYVAEMKTELDPSLPLVPCLISELNQVILNLIINASHTIGDVVRDGKNGRGTITICTAHDDRWAEIRVSDTGNGIPRDIWDRIFEPFFTTKEVGKGSGQGLAVARNVIVNKHRGKLTFETEEGKGTTFIIKLPRDLPNAHQQL